MYTLAADDSDTAQLNVFQRTWQWMGNEINAIRGAGTVIQKHLLHYQTIEQNPQASAEQRSQAAAGLARTHDHLSAWQRLMGYVNKYLPEWQKQGGATVRFVSPIIVSPAKRTEIEKGLGVVPVIIGIAAIGGLTVASGIWLKLRADLAREKAILDRLERGTLTNAQAGDLLKAGSTSLVTIGNSIPMFAIFMAVSVGAYMFMRRT